MRDGIALGSATRDRPPPWDRDEAILALDLYVRAGRRGLSGEDPRVIELSEVLRRLPQRSGQTTSPRLRNPAGVSMKLGNFLSLDPEYTSRGRTGLAAASRVDRAVWAGYAHDPVRLAAVAGAIRASLDGGAGQPADASEIEEDEAEEGRVLYRLHRLREREAGLDRKRKARARAETGALSCEACGMSFPEVYGPVGEGFIECHHQVPVSSLRPGQRTRISDLRLVCANCHRMLHRPMPGAGGPLTVERLRDALRAAAEAASVASDRS